MNTQDNTLWQYQNFFRKKRSDIPFLNGTAITDDQKVNLLAATFQNNFTDNFGECFFDILLTSDMARKKSQANQRRKRLDKFPSPDQTPYSKLPPIALVESHHPTPPRPASTPKDNDSIMELAPPSSTNNSRP
ncbi:hypothetical protein TNIN_300961 [Trichonephila inaurata madagascariensis]|uniref:Uncharacterized protein n=1 Tax=Trichonephila inaurata madagascariensis TaxID=2747483 RepID=A0A8X6YH70_9ARAC|nr:hypothetical protein TNIN_300961 [Trichonephila inaurata madagascariensis]